MVWKPEKALGLAVGLVIPLGIVGADLFLVQSMIRQAPGMSWFAVSLLLAFSLPLLALCIYWYYELVTLRYHLDRNGLVIASGMRRLVVPMDAIRAIIPGDAVDAAGRFRGIGWPGYLRGRIKLRELGCLLMHSTQPLKRQLVVVTESECYGVSPRDPSRFMEDWRVRRGLGPTSELQQGLQLARLAALPIWRDRGFWVLGVLGLTINVALFGLVVSRYGDLPQGMAIHFGAQSHAGGVASSVRVFVVPGIGLLTLVLNGLVGSILHRQERLGAYLMVCMAVSVQAVLLLGAVGVLNR